MRISPVPFLLLTIACVTGVAVHAGAEQAPGRARDAGSATATPAVARVDVNKIDPETFQAIAYRLAEGEAPKIDGHLSEEAWQKAPVQGHFIQREPEFGMPATQPTEFRVLYDARKIYFGVWVWDDNQAGIIASEMKRDSGLRKGDQIKIAIDTFHDHRNSFSFFTNPLGAEKDAQTVENGRTINYDWNAVWEVKTSQDDRGWYIEIAVPLSQLRFPTTVGEATWGFNICRILMRRNEESYWVPFPREWSASGFTRMSHAGVLLGLKDMTSRRRVELLPFLAPKVARDFDARTPLTKDAGYGFDARIGLTSELTADATFKTDFAQVEADQEVVNTTRFSLFFPEKRQFFTESAGIFDYGRSGNSPGGDVGTNDPGLLPVFYSRTIGLAQGQEIPIIGGGKITGRAGPYALGIVNMTTDAATVRVSGRPLAVDRANYTAIRVKRNILSKSTIGGILLNRQGAAGSAHDFNRTAGLDAGLVFGQYLTITSLFAKTFSPASTTKDDAKVLDVIFKTDRYNLQSTYYDIAERFNAEMGFIQRTDVRNARTIAGWTPRPKIRGIRQLQFTGTVDYFENHDGRVDSRLGKFEFVAQRQDTGSFRASVQHDYDYLPFNWQTVGTTIPIGDYGWNTVSTTYATNQSKRLFVTAGADLGGYYDGEKQTARVGGGILLRRALLVEPNYTRNRITMPARPPYVTSTLNLRVSQSFSPHLFLKAFFQYNDERRTASTNFLFWYIYRPGSDFYVVYNDGREIDPPGLHFVRTRNRSLQVKMTYWISR